MNHSEGIDKVRNLTFYRTERKINIADADDKEKLKLNGGVAIFVSPGITHAGVSWLL